jgi:hypothetical protein
MIALFFEFTRAEVVRNVNKNKDAMRLGGSTLANKNISTKNKMFPTSLANKKQIPKNSDTFNKGKSSYLKTLNNISNRYTP